MQGFLLLARPVVFSSVSFYTPVVVLLVYSYREVSPWSLLFFFGPAFAVHTLYRLYREQQEATGELTNVNARLERANISFASALVAALDARDRYTAGHSAAVAVYARDIAARLQLSEEQQQLAHLCGLVHDIGKVGLPPGILEKPGALTLEERRMMEEHSVIGERILANVEDYAEIAKIVRHHHERMDGNGYPDAIPGDEIPLISRIIAVADAYNAMTSGRPYRDAMPTRVARFRLAQAASTQFDTTIVAAFEAILAGSKESYLSGLSADFGVEVQRQPSMRPLAVAQTGLVRRTVASRFGVNAAWRRLSTPSFSSMWWTWAFAVLVLITSLSAISAFERPLRMRSSTSTSRGVRMELRWLADGPPKSLDIRAHERT